MQKDLWKSYQEQIDLVYKKYYNWIETNLDKFNTEYYERYVKMFTNN